MIHIYIKFRCEGVRQNIDTKRIKNYAEWYYSNDLAPHFKFEEEYVFSILGIDNDLIKKALTQHRRLKKYFTKYIESEKSLSRIEEELETLIRFEERTVFPAIRNNIKINRILLSPEVFPYKLNAKEWDDLFGEITTNLKEKWQFKEIRAKNYNREDMFKTFADKVIDFNRQLFYSGKLPEGFKVLNPYLNNPETILVMEKFYHKYYNDTQQRKFIIGINPSRHGAGVTGIPFTDTKRLESICDIEMQSAYTHEISSVFMYDMITEYGGAKKFYSEFYINSPFPLAIIRQTKEGKWLNANYYDDCALFEMVKDFMVLSLKKHIHIGLDISEVYVLGKKNANFIQKLNKEEKLFENIKVLEHPRYIQQYKSKEKQLYIDKYILTLNNIK